MASATSSAAAAPVKGKDVQLKYLVKRLQWTKTRSPGTCLTCQEIWTVLNYACMLILLLTMGVGGLAANAPLSMSPPALLFPHQYMADSGTAAAALTACNGTAVLYAPETPETRTAVTNATALLDGDGGCTVGFASAAELLDAYATTPSLQARARS